MWGVFRSWLYSKLFEEIWVYDLLQLYELLDLPHSLLYLGDVDIRGCEAFWQVIFFKHFDFLILLEKCVHLLCQSFKIQLNLLPSKLLQPSSFSSFSWHMRIWALGYLEKWKWFEIWDWLSNLNYLLQLNHSKSLTRSIGPGIHFQSLPKLAN